MLNISARLNLQTGSFTSGIRSAMSAAQSFANSARSQFSGVSSSAASVGASMRQAASAAASSMRQASSGANASLDSMSQSVRSFGRNVQNALNNGFNDPADKAKIKWKDVARIIQGIIISRIFYDTLQGARAATDAVWQFAESLERTKIAFDNLFGDTQLTGRFISVLKDAAIDNALFDFNAMEGAAKRLLAYGIDYSNLMYVMNGVMAAASVTGDPNKVESISRALGQIYTKGRLMGQEVLQLTEAGVPVFEILNEKMGITEKEMANIADQGITAKDAINALVDGLQEKYGSVLTASKYTMTGMVNNVKDVLLMLGEQAIQPVFNFTKAVLYNMQQALETAYKAMKTGGLGAAFESLVPKEFQETVRTLVAAFMNILLHVGKVAMVLKDLATAILPAISYAFSGVTFVILPFLNALANLTRMITQNESAMRALSAVTAIAASMFLLLKARALGLFVLKGVTSVIMSVSKALGIMAAMSSVAARSLLLIVGLVVALGAGVAAATGKLDGLVKRLSALSGYTADDILQPGAGTGTGDIDEFNNRLGDTADAYKDVEDAAGGASKANEKYKAGLLSFDEVFKLNEPKDDSGSGGGATYDPALDEYGNLAAGGFNVDSLIPDVPSFSEFATDFINSMKDSVLGKLAVAGIAAGIAANLIKALRNINFKDIGDAAKPWATAFATGLLKALIGAVIGLAIHNVASIFTERLWESLEDALSLSETANESANLGALIGSIIGGAIGMIAWGPLGALIAAGIGHMLGGAAGLVSEKIDSFSTTITGTFIGLFGSIAANIPTLFRQVVMPAFTSGGVQAALSAGITGLGTIIKNIGIKAIAKGGIIGMAIGYFTDALAGFLWDALIEKFNLGANAEKSAAFGQTVGTLIGTVVGGILGGPAGALIGAGIGTFAGGFVGVFWEKITTFFSDMFTRFSTWFSETFQPFNQWWNDTVLGFTTWRDNTINIFTTWWTNTTSGFTTWWSNTVTSLGEWWGETIAIFSDWDSITSETFGNWWRSTTEGLGKWVKDTVGSFNGWIVDTFAIFTTWKADTIDSLAQWSTESLTTLATWVATQKQRFDDWKSSIKSKINSWSSETLSAIGSWITNTVTKISGWVTTQKQKFNDWSSQVGTIIKNFCHAALLAFTQWIADNIKKIADWIKDFKDEVKTGFDSVYTTLTNWITDIGKNVFDKLFGWISDAVGKISGFISSVGSMIQAAKDAVSAAATAASAKAQAEKDLEAAEKAAEKAKETTKSTSSKTSSSSKKTSSSSKKSTGHALGGIFNREHIARFAEGNKAEAVIPLENASAMQPFVNAISQGILEGLAPTLVQSTGGSNSGNDLPPMYVGTLIADERGLKQLYKKFELIQVQENARRGLATT